MQLRYPIGYDIKAEQTESGNWKLEYTERFRPEDYEAYKTSIGLIKSLYPGCKLESDRVIISINSTRDEILNFLAGEFLFTSSLGKLSLAELVGALTVKALKKD